MLESGRLGSVTSLALCALICASAVNLALAAFAWAYVDPSVMTYTIQALAGVAVALSAVAGVAFRRGRRIVYQLLDIDEDARKQNLQYRAFDLKEPDHNAHRGAQQQDAHQPVDPRHGRVRHHKAQQFQPVAAGDGGRPLAEKAHQIVPHGDLVHHAEAVCQKPEAQRGEKGQAIFIVKSFYFQMSRYLT